MAANRDFADYCCELLASVGPCVPKRMFGGWGISTDGLTIAIIADLGSGEKLWLKADDDTRSQMEAAGCERFTYASYSAPEDTLESPHAMAPWARMALNCALKVHITPAKYARKATKLIAAKKKPKSTTSSR